MGGDIEVFSGGKVLGGKVQSPESRVQGPVQLLGYAIRQPVQDSMGIV